jgi:hypothetical protein
VRRHPCTRLHPPAPERVLQLRALPALYSKDKQWRGLPLKEIVEAAKADAAPRKTIAILEARWSIHGALGRAFRSLYGCTSDEPGIRHPLVDDQKASLDEADALFMFGACSAFVTYLIEKEKNAKD